MNKIDNLVFTNTCGKIYSDHIVLATSQSEKNLLLSEVKRISFRRGIAISGLLFSAIPGLFLLLSRALEPEQTVLKGVFLFLGIGGIVLSLFKAEKRYTLRVKNINGESYRIKIWEGNVRDAKKFAEIISKMIGKNKPALQPEEKITVHSTVHAA